ncbi:MAG: iron-containing alcohol dehydrogenase [Elusimicrobia bacterium]|nr:iron-containing alcohol dehydrogenase [Elusimicrobiota bacterium]
MVIPLFAFARTPRLVFGPGSLGHLPGIALSMGSTALLVTGGQSLEKSGMLAAVIKTLKSRGLEVFHVAVAGEPTPDFVDSTVTEYREKEVDVVIAVGGGSVMDAGKALAAMLTENVSVMELLEGVGKRQPCGSKLPFIAVPTTAGTGSEATKNAVLSRVGRDGFKKSLRHENFVPEVAVVDPKLTLYCPQDVSAACGVDAFTHLIEGYVSSIANPLTDALAWSGLELLNENLLLACTGAGRDINARSAMSYAAFLSGVALANAGLGIIHGLAGPIGGLFPIPHGVVCGTLAAPAIATNIRALRARGGAGHPALLKYARVGALLCGCDPADTERSPDLLVEKVREWVGELNIGSLADYGVKPWDIRKVIDSAGMKENPVALEMEEVRGILMSRIAGTGK